MPFFGPGNFCAKLALATGLYIPLVAGFMVPVVNEVLVSAGGYFFASRDFFKPGRVTGEMGGHIRILPLCMGNIGPVGVAFSMQAHVEKQD